MIPLDSFLLFFMQSCVVELCVDYQLNLLIKLQLLVRGECNYKFASAGRNRAMEQLFPSEGECKYNSTVLHVVHLSLGKRKVGQFSIFFYFMGRLQRTLQVFVEFVEGLKYMSLILYYTGI